MISSSPWTRIKLTSCATRSRTTSSGSLSRRIRPRSARKIWSSAKAISTSTWSSRLGVKQQQDLDEAITSHGRILHDATVASITTGSDAGLGTIIWKDPQASSLSELVTELAASIGDNVLDNQIATALLTGIVAETGRFSNDKTSSQTMSASSALLAAGANQQLVASKLEEPEKPQAADKKPDKKQGSVDAGKNDDGSLSIDHESDAGKGKPPAADEKPQGQPAELPAPQAPPAPPPADTSPPAGDQLSSGPEFITEPPRLGGTLSANTQPEGLDPVTDPMSMPRAETDQLLNRSPEPPASTPPAPAPATDLTPPPADWTPPPPATPPANPAPGQGPPPAASMPDTPESNQTQTLSEIEQSVHSPHIDPAQLDNARDEVSQALVGSPENPTAIQALNSQPLGEELRPPPPPPLLPSVTPANKDVLPLGPTPSSSADTNPPPPPSAAAFSPSAPTPQVNDPTAPPPVPPPIPFQFGNNSPNAPAPAPPNQQPPPL